MTATFDPGRQFRCAIIRGRSKQDLDDLLPIYAKIVTSLCPMDSDQFAQNFRTSLARALPMSADKTLNNHRTETVGSLFAMFYESQGTIYSSERTDKLLSDGDQPAFFKDWCFKLEYPNGMNSLATLKEYIEQKLRFRPCCFILQLIELFNREKVLGPTVDEVGYYVLNALQVLQGLVSPRQVLEAIQRDRAKKILREVYVEGMEGSYSKQHIRELIGYLELANLVTISGEKRLQLNPSEANSIKLFLQEPYSKLIFDVYKYDLEDEVEKRRFWSEWSVYLGKVAFRSKEVFESKVSEFVFASLEGEFEQGASSPLALGDDGEKLVFQYEKNRVRQLMPRFVDRVKIVGRTKGLGYDVHSIVGEGDKPSHSIFIEVKSTQRVTTPALIEDNFVLTRNEYLTAEQHGPAFWIYRVYFSKDGVFIYRMKDPIALSNRDDGRVSIEATHYRLEFSGKRTELEQIV